MARQKPAPLSSSLLSPSLVAVKGQAAAAVESIDRPMTASATLNFKVPMEFRRRFRQRAAAADLQLNDLLQAALAAWEREQGLS